MNVLKTVDEALDPVPLSIDAAVKWIACPLARSVGDHRTDFAATQVASDFICAIALAADEPFCPYAWSSTSHQAVFHQRLEVPRTRHD